MANRMLVVKSVGFQKENDLFLSCGSHGISPFAEMVDRPGGDRPAFDSGLEFISHLSPV